MSALRVFFVGLIFGVLPLPGLSAEWFDLQIYSNLNYVSDEGETYGLEVSIVPSTYGQFVLWRSADGKMQDPVLLPVDNVGNRYTVNIPKKIDGGGVWKLLVTQKYMNVEGPRGEKMSLSRRK